jgi:hypothetical protein
LKDGSTSEGKKILIDGQQRITALTAAILGQYVINSSYERVKIKIASNTEYGGNNLRKAIDYFCHLAAAPEFYSHIVDNDRDFAQTGFSHQMEWLKTENDDLY